MATDVKIDIAAEYTGKKAFSQADKSVDKLSKGVKKLAAVFGLTFGAAQMARYAQNAVKAFADSQLEAVQLTNAVKNLGLAFASRDIDIYLDKVERATGINRDQLQPAMVKLLQVTGSVNKSQELLNLAMDVAAGTGQDLTSTSEKLSQAYVGNFKGLRSLNLGLTQAELASSNFEDVQKRLQVLFAGQATSAADSYVGSMNKLSIASEQASEKIGKSLVDALTAVSGGTTVDDTVKKIDTLSSAIAGLIDVTVGLKAGEYLKQYYALKSGAIAGGFGNRSMSVLGQDTQKSDLTARKKAETDAKKRAAELLAAQKKTLKSQQDALKLAKARAVFDLQKIQIEAALKGKISEEDRIRLKLMQAIEDENISQIEIYTKLLDTAQKNTEKLVSTLQSIKPLDDVFKNWNFMSVKEQLASLEIYFKNFAGSAASAFNALSQAQQASLGGFKPFVGASIPSSGGATTSMPSTVGLGTSGTGSQLPAGITINNNVQTGVGDPNAIAEAIENVLVEANYRGTLRGLLAI
jgi:predicted transcriptional regulator